MQVPAGGSLAASRKPICRRKPPYLKRSFPLGQIITPLVSVVLLPFRQPGSLCRTSGTSPKQSSARPGNGTPDFGGIGGCGIPGPIPFDPQSASPVTRSWDETERSSLQRGLLARDNHEVIASAASLPNSRKLSQR